MAAEKPHREPASGPTIPKAPAGHPAARTDGSPVSPSAEPREQPVNSQANEETVNYGGRIPKSLRQRARVYVATHDVEHQEFLAAALHEYLDRHGG